MTAVTREADAILHALIIINNSIRLSLISPQPLWTMNTSSPRTDSFISTLQWIESDFFLNRLFFYLVSRLLNFLVITLPGSRPSRAQINFVNSGCDEPPNTFILGILGHNDGRVVDLAWWGYECWLESESVRIFKYVSSS
jgi:hypothetical protein